MTVGVGLLSWLCWPTGVPAPLASASVRSFCPRRYAAPLEIRSGRRSWSPDHLPPSMLLGWGWHILMATWWSSPLRPGRRVSPVAVREGSSNVDGNPLEGCSDVFLVHQALTSDSGTLAGCTGATLVTPPLVVAHQMQPIVPLPDFVDGLVESNVFSGGASVHLRHTSFTLLQGMAICAVFFFPVGWLSVTLQYAVSHCEGFQLDPVALVDGAPVIVVPHSRRCPAFTSRSSGPNSAKVLTISSGRSNYPHYWSVRPLFKFVAVGALFCAWSSGHCVCIRLFQSLTVFRCKFLLLQTLNPSSRLPSRFLKFSSQVRAKWSMRRWNYCPYKYLWKCSRVFTMASNSQRVTE